MTRKGRPSRLPFPTEPPVTEPVKRAAFARFLKCDPPRVTEWVKKGTITPPAVTSSGDIIPSFAVEQMDAAQCFGPRDVAAGVVAAVAGDQATVSYDQARTATEVLKAHTALLDLRVRRSELIEGDLAEGVLFDCLRAVRDAWQVWPARVVPDMAVKLGVAPAVLLALLEGAIRTHLADLADPKADWRRQSQNRLGGQGS